MVQIEDVIKERETNMDDLNITSPQGDEEMVDAPPSETPKGGRKTAPSRVDKRQIEQRIEEDRERHKRERESIWAIPRGDEAELSKLWEETSDFGADDERLLAEESDEFGTEMAMQKCHHQRPANGSRR